MSSFLAMRIRPWGLLGAVGGLAITGTVAGFAATLGWVFDLACNFRVQYFATLALLAVLFSLGRRYRVATGFGAVALLNLATIIPLYIGGESAGAPSIRAILLNVHTENRRFDLVRELIQREKPDVVVFEEVNDEWLGELTKLGDDYSHILPAPRPDNFGIALFSRWPMQDAEIREIGEAEIPSILAHITIREKGLTIIGTHPLPPSNPQQFALRNEQIAALAKLINVQSGPLVVLGDLNATPWSPHFRRLLAAADVRDAAHGHGLNASWPVPIFPMRIPIDHCLVSRDVHVLKVRLGPNVGSDHFAVIVDFAL
jgi:endonuclease/exonuclease/phosphatase (EEP) superfamily protein YafD